MVDGITRHLSSRGFVRINDEAALDRVTWFHAMGNRVWKELRNASYRLLSFEHGREASSGIGTTFRIRLSQGDARFDDADHRATAFAMTTLIAYSRDEGWPRRIARASSVQTALATFSVHDGRRFLNAQYPGPVGRPPHGGSNVWAFTDTATDYSTRHRDEGLAVSILVPMEPEDVLLTRDYLEEGFEGYSERLSDRRSFLSVNPLSSVYLTPNVPEVSYLLRQMKDSGGTLEWSMWQSEAEFWVVARDISTDHPGVIYWSFESDSGLMTEASIVVVEPGGRRLGGAMTLHEYEECKSSEGTVLRLPVLRVQTSGPPHDIAALFGASPVEIDVSLQETSTFVFYDRLNDAALEAQAHYDLGEWATRTGLRIADTRSTDRIRVGFGPHKTIHGPRHNDLSLFEKWDILLRETMQEAGLPVPWEDILPYSEIAARTSTRAPRWSRYQWSDDGEPTRVPSPDAPTQRAAALIGGLDARSPRAVESR